MNIYYRINIYQMLQELYFQKLLSEHFGQSIYAYYCVLYGIRIILCCLSLRRRNLKACFKSLHFVLF